MVRRSVALRLAVTLCGVAAIGLYIVSVRCRLAGSDETSASDSGTPRRVAEPRADSEWRHVGPLVREPPASEASVEVAEATTLLSLRGACERNHGHAEQANATLAMPMHLWAAVRIHAAASVAADACASSRWPLRWARRPFVASELLAPPEAQAAHGYLVADLPAAWSDALIAHVDRAAACTALTAADRWAKTLDGGPPRPVALPLQDAARAATVVADTLCGRHDLPNGPRQLRLRAAQGGGLVSVERRCNHSAVDGATTNPPLSADAAATAPLASAAVSAVWGALLDGQLPDRMRTAKSSVPVPCGVRLAPAQMTAMLAANAAAIYAAAPTAKLWNPAALAAAVRAPAPVDNLLPLLLPNAAEVAAAADTGDARALLEALAPPVLRRSLPGLLTSFNVMVSPMGVLTAAIGDRSPASPRVPRQQAACPPFLNALFEPVDPEAAAREAAAVPAFESDAVGGPDALARLRRLAPRAVLLPYWPPASGIDLAESCAHGPVGENTTAAAICESATLDVYNVATPYRDDVQVPHAACDDWDAAAAKAGMPPATLVSEVVVLSHITDLYYWVAVDVVGRLQLLAPYLVANPHVRLHLSHLFVKKWADDPSHFARQWLEGMGLADRVITGRVLARVAHVLDRSPVGPRVHPLQLLAVRDAGDRVLASAGRLPLADYHARARALASAPDVTPGSHRNGSLLLIQRKANGPRSVTNLNQLELRLRLRGLNPLVWDPPRATPGSLAATIAEWASADVVVASHGSGLANALFMRPGATVVETVPQGHAGSGLYYLQLAHVVRLQHHHIVMPGTLGTPVGHDTVLVEAILCGDVLNRTAAARSGGDSVLGPFAGRCADASASRLQLRDAALQRPRRYPGQLLECLPAQAARDLTPTTTTSRLWWPRTAPEPFRALTPVADAVVTVPCPRQTAFSLAGGNAESHRAWSSHPDVLPYSEVRAIALLLPGGAADAEFFAVDPTQRGLVRALEAARILPVALPGLLCCPPVGICYLNFTEDCWGAHGTALLALVGRILHDVAAARNVSVSALPIVTAGLSSGAGMGGLIAAHTRVDGVFAQLEPPALLMLRAYNDSRSGSRRDGPGLCSAPPSPSRRGADDSNGTILQGDLVPPPPPPRAEPLALWMTVAAVNGPEGRAMKEYGDAWLRAVSPSESSSIAPGTGISEVIARAAAGTTGTGADSDRLVLNSWAPTAMSATTLHRAAPWLISHAASTAFVEAALTTGVLRVPSAEQLAAYRSYRPWCPRDRSFADRPWPDDAAAEPPAATTEAALFMPMDYSDVQASFPATLYLLQLAVEFREPVPPANLFAGDGQPLFTAAGELASRGFARQRTVRFQNATAALRCEYAVDATDTPPAAGARPGAVAGAVCAAAGEAFEVLSRWLMRSLKATTGEHEYHEPPYEDVVAWMSRLVDRGTAAGASPTRRV